ncbi:unnamed protein product, partial [Leptidea sinapis]
MENETQNIHKLRTVTYDEPITVKSKNDTKNNKIIYNHSKIKENTSAHKQTDEKHENSHAGDTSKNNSVLKYLMESFQQPSSRLLRISPFNSKSDCQLNEKRSYSKKAKLRRHRKGPRENNVDVLFMSKNWISKRERNKKPSDHCNKDLNIKQSKSSNDLYTLKRPCSTKVFWTKKVTCRKKNNFV